MPFKFSWLCELLDELEVTKYEHRATQARNFNPSHRVVGAWFSRHNDHIVRHGPAGIALLSALFPERRADRTYNLQEKRLTQLVSRILGLGATRSRLLRAYERSGGPDFATCVENVMKETELSPRKDDNVTLEEIDLALTEIAAGSISSAPCIRARSTGRQAWVILAPILQRLRSNEAKWLVRMIHKSYAPVEIPEYVTMHAFHFMLPKLLEIHNSLEATIKVLARPEIARLPSQPAKEFELALMPFMFKEILPELGIMIRRQPLEKARSIKHCVKLANSRTMSIERKHDGEYCQIHVHVDRKGYKIQMFSKSGRDSTQDRSALLECIRIALNLDKAECKIKGRAILEAELVVYSTTQQVILPFYHIRKHVLHGGRRIGTAMDSPKKSGEQLMVVFFDVLLLDDKPLINEPHRRRRQYLKGLVHTVEGTSQVVERAIIDFSHKKAKSALRAAFGSCIRKRWEGFVLKGLEEPYLSLKQNTRSIKFKKDYIAGLGDTADLCIIGGRRDARVEIALNLGALTWTFFYVACLLNKEQVRRHDARPSFRIIDRIGPGSMSSADISELNLQARLVQQEFLASSPYMQVEQPRRDFPPPTHMFTKPMIVEIMGAGFERPQTVNFYVIRFPRRVGSKIKIHRDREIADTVSFVELQEMAEKSLYEQHGIASQEEIEWIDRLEAADPKRQSTSEDSQSTRLTKTPQSAATVTLSATLSIRASTQPSPTLVLTDSEELTLPEWMNRHPESAPQTPARYSDSTVSPVTTWRSIASPTFTKRRLLSQEESPMYQIATKKARVAFDTKVITAQIPKKGGPLLDVTNTWNRTRIAEHTSGVANTIAGTCTTTKKRFSNGAKPNMRSIKMVNGLATPMSTAESIHDTDKAQVQQSQSCMQPSEPSTSSPPPRGYINLDPQEVLAFVMEWEESPAPRLAQAGPLVWVTPSVRSKVEADVGRKTELAQGELDFNVLKEKLVQSMVDAVELEGAPRYKHIIIVDASEKPELGVRDLKSLCEEILGRSNSAIESIRHSDLLIFDYRVFGTRFFDARFDFQHSEVAQHLEEAQQWFCGLIEVSEDDDLTTANQGKYRIGINWDVSLSEAVNKGI